jgi:hypothetical protein
LDSIPPGLNARGTGFVDVSISPLYRALPEVAWVKMPFSSSCKEDFSAVIPAKAGIQKFGSTDKPFGCASFRLDARFRGHDRPTSTHANSGRTYRETRQEISGMTHAGLRVKQDHVIVCRKTLKHHTILSTVIPTKVGIQDSSIFNESGFPPARE